MDVNKVLKCTGLELKWFQEQKEWNVFSIKYINILRKAKDG
jgi:hypothetical protein